MPAPAAEQPAVLAHVRRAQIHAIGDVRGAAERLEIDARKHVQVDAQLVLLGQADRQDRSFDQHLQRFDVDSLDGRLHRVVFRLGRLDQQRIRFDDRSDPDITLAE